MGKDIADICKQAWRQMVIKSDVDPSLYSRFDTACLNNMIDADSVSVSPAKQCLWKHAGDKFVFDRKKQKIALPEKEVVSCLVALATREEWLSKKPDGDKKPAGGLPADATPTDPKPAVGLPSDATPTDLKPAVGLPSDATPTDPKPAVGLPSDATPTAAADFSWYSRMFADIGGGILIHAPGLSVDGADPVQRSGFAGFAVQGGVLLTRIPLASNWVYETAVFVSLAALLGDTQFANIYDISGGISPQFSRTLPKTDAISYQNHPIVSKLILAPRVAGGMGTLWSKAPIDVGIADKLYWASNSYQFPLMTLGMDVCLEVYPDYKSLSLIGCVQGGARWFWHKDPVTNGPAGTVIRLQSPTWDALGLKFGFRY